MFFFCVSVSVPFIPYLLRGPVLSPQRSRLNTWLTLGSESHVFSHHIPEIRSCGSFWYDTLLLLIGKGRSPLNIIRTRPLPVIRISKTFQPRDSKAIHAFSHPQCFLIQSARAVFQRLSRESRLSIILYPSCQDLCFCFVFP